MVELARFEETVGRLETSLTSHAAEMRRVEAKLSRLGRYMIAVAAATFVAVLLTLTTVKLNLDTRDSADRREADQAEARVSACVQSNVSTQKTREALVQSILALAADPEHLTPEQQAIADRYRARVDAALPYRDCDAKGISAYYEDPPADPAKGG